MSNIRGIHSRCIPTAFSKRSQPSEGQGQEGLEKGFTGSSLGASSHGEDILIEKPSLEDRVRDMEAELVSLRKRSTKADRLSDDNAIRAPSKLISYDPISLKEPRTLHSWDWLSKGKWGWTRWLLVEDLFEVCDLSSASDKQLQNALGLGL